MCLATRLPRGARQRRRAPFCFWQNAEPRWHAEHELRQLVIWRTISYNSISLPSGSAYIKRGGSYNRIWNFLTHSGCRDKALLVLGSHTAKQAVLTALLDSSTHFRPPLTHTSHHRPALVDFSRFRVSPILTHSHFRRFSTCVSVVSGVSLVGVTLLSADVAVTVVRPEVISQRVFISRGRTRAHWKAFVQAHTIGQ